MTERPWHRINCACPECRELPTQPSRWDWGVLAVLLLVAWWVLR